MLTLNELVVTTEYLVGRVAQSVQRLATGWTVRGSNPGGGEIFPHLSRPVLGPPSLLYSGYRFFPGVKCGRGVNLTPHLLLVPWSRKSRAIPLLPPMGRTACTEPQCLYSTAIPLPPLWAVRPVQSLSACTRVHFTFSFFYRISHPVGRVSY